MKVSKSSSAAMDESPFGVYILDGGTEEYVNVLKVVMQLMCPRGHLPEIFSIFGRDTLLKFLDVFSGTTVKVPSRDVIERCMRDVVIYLDLEKTPVSNRNREIRALAGRYSTTAGDIRSTFVRIEKEFKAQRLQV